MRIEGDVDPKGIRACKHLIAEGICRDAVYVHSTPSTNTLALAALLAGEVATDRPTLFLTDDQTSGRGRHGRHWKSDDATLTFSFAWTPPSESEQAIKKLSLAVGVGIARCLEFEFAPLKTKLKWPNDVYVDGGKVAGILLETPSQATSQIVIGVGVNVGSKPDLGDDPSSHLVRSLQDATQRSIHRYDLLVPIVGRIVESISEVASGSNTLMDEFRQRCYLSGEEISFRSGASTKTGKCLGINNEGELVVETESKRTVLQSGEVVRKSKYTQD